MIRLEKSLFHSAFAMLMACSLVLVLSINCGVVQASTGVAGIIGSNTVWTRANSPYVVTGNVLVDNGVTLTIEAGVTVNLNDFYIMVNGTLRAQGTETDPIQFSGGEIVFTQHSQSWNKQTGSGSIIEYANLPSTHIKISFVSPKINGNNISNISLGGSTILTNNIISQTIAASSKLDSPILTGNTILQGGYFEASGAAVISHNTISGEFSCSSSDTVSYNTVSGSLTVGGSALVTNNNVSGSMGVSGSVVASNNIVSDSIQPSVCATVTNNIMSRVFVSYAKWVIISNNIIHGGIRLQPPMRSFVNASILNNTITGADVGIYLSPTSAINLIGGCASDAYIYGNIIANCSTAGIQVEGVAAAQGGYEPDNTAIIVANTIVNTTCGIDIKGGINEIRNNVIAENELGISYGSTIEGNLIINNTCGIKGGHKVKNNTIANNSVGIESTSIQTLVYNNIYDNSEYNIKFLSTSSLNATYNWWGTTDTEAIAQTIYDYYEDFYLGKVNFTPLLTEPNPQSPSLQDVVVPEFPSWILVPMFLLATLAVASLRTKTTRRTEK
ncbi:MAG: right-handed parallel beta-helix repeat-containing protein [Candidatus Bathyarchaeota archaeon]|nr:right-handed parallel beta-helix repeat-containing protein [Candidatus Bathyarchaeota archaeon]